jgi:hypothetical protein
MIALQTRSGQVTITPIAPATRQCAGPCGDWAEIHIITPTSARVPICGQCLVTALATWLGAQHLRAGGRLEDLQIQPTRLEHRPDDDTLNQGDQP